MHDPFGDAMLWFIATMLCFEAVMLWFCWEDLILGDLHVTSKSVARYRADRDAAQAALDALGGQHGN